LVGGASELLGGGARRAAVDAKRAGALDFVRA
jgi:hypothetical protein